MFERLDWIMPRALAEIAAAKAMRSPEVERIDRLRLAERRRQVHPVTAARPQRAAPHFA